MLASTPYQVLALMGPTASGKTALAMQLADHQPIDIISVDSALVYRGMDIGTAKPTRDELRAYPHALVDILDPSEHYSAANFCVDAKALIEQSLAAKRLPVLVGGTMLYFNALLQGLDDLPARDPELRQRLEQRLQETGMAAGYQWLQRLDPVAAAGMHANNRQRLVRALEVCLLTGQPMSSFWQSDKPGLPWTVLAVGLLPGDRSWLHQRINLRFEQMLDQGLLDEVRQLQARADLSPELPSIRSVGYRQAWQFLQGQTDRQTMIEQAQAASRQLAKRQMTWMRGMSGLHIMTAEDQNPLTSLLKLLNSPQTNQ